MQRPSVIIIPPGASGSGFYNDLNNNFAMLADALENALDRFGTLPNQMESDLDMNSFRIINCADPINPSDVVTLRFLINEIGKYVAAAAVRWRGLWAVGNTYEPFDLVHHNGNVYIAIGDHTASPGDEPGVGPGWTTYWDLFLAGLTGSPISAVSVNACPSGPVNANTDGQTAICQLSSAIDNINTTVNNLPGTNVNINACPSGPVNANTDVQNAICTLSNAVSNIPASNVQITACPPTIPADTDLQTAICSILPTTLVSGPIVMVDLKSNIPWGIGGRIPFDTATAVWIVGATVDTTNYTIDLPAGRYEWHFRYMGKNTSSSASEKHIQVRAVPGGTVLDDCAGMFAIDWQNEFFGAFELTAASTIELFDAGPTFIAVNNTNYMSHTMRLTIRKVT